MEFRQNFTKAVKRHISTEVPFGVFLSGGLNSSIIAAVASRECKRLGLAKLATFTIGLKESKALKNAQIVADFLGTDHYPIEFTKEEGTTGTMVKI